MKNSLIIQSDTDDTLKKSVYEYKGALTISCHLASKIVLRTEDYFKKQTKHPQGCSSKNPIQPHSYGHFSFLLPLKASEWRQ